MHVKAFRNLLALALCCALLAGAEDKAGQTAAEPELGALQQQNAILEQRIKLMTLQQSMLQTSVQSNGVRAAEGQADHKEDATIDSVRNAYASLAGLAPEVAKELACSGNNVVIYGPAQTESLVSLQAFINQLENLRSSMKAALDAPLPSAPDATAGAGGVSGSVVSGAVLQSVIDLISLFHAPARVSAWDVPVDDSAVAALVGKAATAAGCVVYWPEEFGGNPFTPTSQVTVSLQTLADLNDSGGAVGKPAGLQQKLLALEKELKRAEVMIRGLSQKIEREKTKITDAIARVESFKAEITFIAGQVKDEKNAPLQDKLNKTFEKSWDELEAAVKRQLGANLPGTIEDVGRMGELQKRLDVLKARTDFLAQYVRDEKTIALQDKLKRFLATAWDQFESSLRSQQALQASVMKAIEPDQVDIRRWDEYSANLKDMMRATAAASEAYATFRGSLLDGGSGMSPLSRMLRAEALHDLTFDDNQQQRAGATVVQLKVQRITSKEKVSTKEISGGVVLSFVQYQPNGKLKNSGVLTAYGPIKQ